MVLKVFLNMMSQLSQRKVQFLRVVKKMMMLSLVSFFLTKAASRRLSTAIRRASRSSAGDLLGDGGGRARFGEEPGDLPARGTGERCPGELPSGVLGTIG